MPKSEIHRKRLNLRGIQLSKVTINIEILFNSSKSLEPKHQEIKFGKYKIRTIPTLKESLTDTNENLILEFQDVWKKSQLYSYPEKEGDYILSLLSLLFEAKIDFVASKSNNVQGTIKQRSSFYSRGTLETSFDIEDMLSKLNSMDIDLLRQFLRSCNVYRTALSLIDNNPTLSFFLLVTAIEAISGKVIGKTEAVNFEEFITTFLPKSLKDEIGDEKLLLLLIKEAYKMRCAFTHGGIAISTATRSADRSNRNYVKHYVEKKETYSPSLRWFSKVVRAVLTNYLEQLKKTNAESKISDIAREEAVMYVKPAKTIGAGKLVTTKDLDLDFKG